MPKIFTEEELENIINDYRQGMSVSELGRKYNRKPEVILTKLNSIGVYEYKLIRWTNEEIQILKNNYSTLEWEELLKLLHRHKKEDIITKAYKLGIKREQYYWNDEDICILKNAYSQNLKISDIEKLFNNKFTYSAITTKAKALGIIKVKKWTEKETLDELSIAEKQNFTDYTEIELDMIVNKFYEVQSRYPLGLCLCKEIHKDFHDKYGYGNNTPEQFEEYLKENNLKIA